MKKKYKFSEENKETEQLNEAELFFQTKLDRSIQQAKEGKTVKVTSDEELKKLLDSL